MRQGALPCARGADGPYAVRHDVAASRGRACSRVIVRRAGHGDARVHWGRRTDDDVAVQWRRAQRVRYTRKPGRVRGTTTVTDQLHYCNTVIRYNDSRRPLTPSAAVDDGTYARGRPSEKDILKIRPRRSVTSFFGERRPREKTSSSAPVVAHWSGDFNISRLCF